LARPPLLSESFGCQNLLTHRTNTMRKKIFIAAAVLLVLVAVGGICAFLYSEEQRKMWFIETNPVWRKHLAMWSDNELDHDLEDFARVESRMDQMGRWVSAERKDAIRANIRRRKDEIIDMKSRLRPKALEVHLLQFKADKQALNRAYEGGKLSDLKSAYEGHQANIAKAKEALAKLTLIPESESSHILANAFRNIVIAEEEVNSKDIAEVIAQLESPSKRRFIDRLSMDNTFKRSVEWSNFQLRDFNDAAQRFGYEHGGVVELPR
jgi:hypothetical protein